MTKHRIYALLAVSSLIAVLAVLFTLANVHDPTDPLKDHALLEVNYQAALAAREYRSFAVYLQKETFKQSFLNFFRLSKIDTSYLHYLLAKVRLEELTYAENLKDDRLEYYHLRRDYYGPIHADLKRAISFRPESYVLDAQYLDWEVWIEQGYTDEATAALEHFKELLSNYVHKTGDMSELKKYADRFKARPEQKYLGIMHEQIAGMQGYIQAIYAVQMEGEAKKSSSPDHLGSILNEALKENNEMLVRAVLQQYAAALLESDMPAEETMKKGVELFQKLIDEHDRQVEDIDNNRPEDIYGVKKLEYLYEAVAIHAEAFVRKFEGSSGIDRFYYFAGRGYEGSKNRDRAAQWYKRIVDDCPESALFREAVSRANYCYQAEEAKIDLRSERFLQETLQKYPRHEAASFVSFTLGFTYLYYEDVEKGIEMLRRTAADYPGTVDSKLAREEVERYEGGQVLTRKGWVSVKPKNA